MSKLLIDEPPLQVLPSLAVSIGLNEAIIVQQIHYWLKSSSGKTFDGRKWVYNSYIEWAKQFPFWCKETISRSIRNAEKQGILLSRQGKGFDRKKWYSINYDALDGVILKQSIATNCSDGLLQDVAIRPPQIVAMLTETTETTTETTTERGAESAPTPPTSKTGEFYPILLLRQITGRTPKRQLHEILCDALGAQPDENKLVACWVEWISRDYNPNNYAWVLDWYKNGMPQNGKSNPRNHNADERHTPKILN